MSDLEIQYSDNVIEARSLIKNKNNYQMRVARLCLDVCEIKKGGNHEGFFTVQDFAKDIGVKVKTLYNWIEHHRRIFSKLDAETKKHISQTAINEIYRKTTRNTPTRDIVELAKQYAFVNNADLTAARYIQALRSLTKLYTDKDGLERLSKETSESTKYYVDILADILSRVKAKDHQFITSQQKKPNGGSLPVPGWYDDEDGMKIKISGKDVDVLRYLRQHGARSKKGLSPTSIGVKLGNKTKSDASAWACRSLEKLVTLGYAQRIDGGSYLPVKSSE